MNKKILMLVGVLSLGTAAQSLFARRFAGGAALGFMAGRSSRRRDKVVVYQQPGPYYRDIVEHDKELKHEVEKLRRENRKLKKQLGQKKRTKTSDRRRRRKH